MPRAINESTPLADIAVVEQSQEGMLALVLLVMEVLEEFVEKRVRMEDGRSREWDASRSTFTFQPPTISRTSHLKAVMLVNANLVVQGYRKGLAGSAIELPCTDAIQLHCAQSPILRHQTVHRKPAQGRRSEI